MSTTMGFMSRKFLKGSMSRKFLSLIVNEHTPGFKSLRCIDLTLQKFFYDAPAGGGARDAATSRPPAAASETETMGTLCLPRPSFTFRPGNSDANDEWGMHCFPLGDRKVICADQSGLAFAFDAETRIVSTMRGLGRPKRMPFSLSNTSWGELRTRRGPRDFNSSLFVMERFPEPAEKKVAKKSGQFEGFFNDFTKRFFKWYHRLLPPPPFAVLKAGKGGMSSSTRPGPVEITAYTMVGRGGGSSSRPRVHVDEWCGGTYFFEDGSCGTYFFEDGSCVCVSAAGAGTYCMDMEQEQLLQPGSAWDWTQVGEWMLPFRGKVEYVPELKLWLGFSAESRHLAAADLSGMDSLSKNQEPPQVVGTWQELDPPKEWGECRDPQLVNLGSGRFCIARFFKTDTTSGSSSSSDDDGETGEDFAVLTGVELVPCLDDDGQAGDDDSGNGKVTKLRMIKHMSRRLHGGGAIDAVF